MQTADEKLQKKKVRKNTKEIEEIRLTVDGVCVRF